MSNSYRLVFVVSKSGEPNPPIREIASMNAELQKQLATATERMATTRWWRTAILLGGMGIVAVA